MEQPIQIPPAPALDSPKPNKRAMLYAIGGIVILGLAIALFIVYSKKASAPTVSTSPTAEPTSQDSSKVIHKEGIVWLSAPQKLSNLKLVTRSSPLPTSYYKLGSENGNDIVFASAATDTIEGDYYFFFVKNGDTYSYLSQNSTLVNTFLESGFNFPQNVTVDSMAFYPALSSPNPMTFKGQLFHGGGNGLIAEYENPILLGETESGKFYSILSDHLAGMKLQKFFMKLPSGLTTPYYLDNWAFRTDDSSLQITWSDSRVNTTYFAFHGVNLGCGNGGRIAILPNASLDQLHVAGTTGTGESVYEFNNPDNPITRAFYDQTNGVYSTFDPQTGMSQEHTLSFEQYSEDHPVFLYKDSLGDWVVFNNTSYGGGAECGKPVIYLYPTQPTQVSVKVGAKITKSEPDYGTGWNVLAEPTGKQTLFWEGLGNGMYPEITEGFVIKQADLEKTLRNHLAQLGLNDREANDFMEFWWPKMPTSPYVRLTWFGTRQMNELAPLYVSPRPDSEIRIFLDFEGLQKPISIPAQHLSSIPRTGFALVEWGGLLRK